MERLQKQMDFLVEIDKIKTIFRQNYLADGKRKENDAEHSWHLAVMAPLLAEYAEEGTDIFRTMQMALIHDLVEIDAGDTFAYDEAALATQRERELAAADRIFSLLPEDQAKEYRALWDEFEASRTKEARFARVLDNCQPLLLNQASGGISWQEHRVKKSQVYKRNVHTPEYSPRIWEYMKGEIQKSIEKGYIIDDLGPEE